MREVPFPAGVPMRPKGGGRRLLVGFVLLGTTWAVLPCRAETLRVLLLRDQTAVEVSGLASWTATDASGRRTVFRPAGGAVRFGVVADRLVASGEEFRPPVRLESPFVLSVAGRPYRGDLVLHLRDGRLVVVNEIDLEEYLYGVVPQEVPRSWSDEVIKAQCVVARTFALSRRNPDPNAAWDLDDSTLSQMYGGYAKEDERVNRLVDRTAGEVLYYEGRPAVAYYHSTCGGRTEDAAEVWGGRVFYLRSVPCPWCVASPYSRWVLRISAERLADRLRGAGPFEARSLEVRVLSVNASGRVSSVEVSDATGRRRVLRGNEFRSLVGNGDLRSLAFTVVRQADEFVFQGRGWGHGVGLCQWGAKALSDAGVDYRRILSHYYPGTKLVRPGRERR